MHLFELSEDEASESDNEGATFAGRRYAKKRNSVAWTELGKFSRISMPKEDIKRAVLTIAEAQILPFLGQERDSFKVLASDLSKWKVKYSYVGHDGTEIVVYNCCGKNKFSCKSSIRVKTSEAWVIVEGCFLHTAESHAHDQSVCMPVAIKNKAIRLIRKQPALSARNIMHSFKRTGDELDEKYFKGIQRLVQRYRPQVEANATGGVQLVGPFRQLADTLWFQDALER